SVAACAFLLSCSSAPRATHSFPTRRLPIFFLASRYPFKAENLYAVCFKLLSHFFCKPLSICLLIVEKICILDVQLIFCENGCLGERKSTRLNSSHVKISYAVFCVKNSRVTT